jgi:hypothetical protein
MRSRTIVAVFVATLAAIAALAVAIRPEAGEPRPEGVCVVVGIEAAGNNIPRMLTPQGCPEASEVFDPGDGELSGIRTGLATWAAVARGRLFLVVPEPARPDRIFIRDADCGTAIDETDGVYPSPLGGDVAVVLPDHETEEGHLILLDRPGPRWSLPDGWLNGRVGTPALTLGPDPSVLLTYQVDGEPMTAALDPETLELETEVRAPFTGPISVTTDVLMQPWANEPGLDGGPVPTATWTGESWETDLRPPRIGTGGSAMDLVDVTDEGFRYRMVLEPDVEFTFDRQLQWAVVLESDLASC